MHVRESRSRAAELHEGLPGPDLQREWDELAIATGAAPWSRPGWVVPWWRAFGGDPAVLVLRADDRSARAVLPLHCARGGLVSPTNWHSPEFAPVAVDDQAIDDVLAFALDRCGGRLTLDFTAEELAERLGRVAVAQGGRSSSRVLESSPYLELVPGWEDGLDSHLRAELRRRERRLAERGQVELDLQDGRADLDGLLVEAFVVEASGWKGRNGTAIASSPATRDFYEQVCAWAADEGLLRLALLRLDGRPLAVDLAVEHGGAQYLLKTGFDEAERALAPGKLLRLKVLQDCTSRGVGTYELLGHAQAWKHEWTPLRRHRLQVHAFPPGAAGVGQWALHAGALPVARTVRDRVLELRDARRTAS